MSGQEAVEVISETLFKLLTAHRCLRYRLLQDTSFKLSRRRRHCRDATSFDRAAYRRQSFMAHGTLHRMLAHEPISFRTHYTLNVVGQKIFEIHTKHLYFSLPAAFCSGSFPSPASIRMSPRVLCLTHRNNFHSAKNLRELNASAIDSRLDRSFRNLQQIDDLLVTQLFNVSQYHARS